MTVFKSFKDWKSSVSEGHDYKTGDNVMDHQGNLYRVFGAQGTNLIVATPQGQNKKGEQQYGGTVNLHTSKARKLHHIPPPPAKKKAVPQKVK